MREPHEVLGVERNASREEVKRAYRQKVKQYHPDRCDREDAEEIFKRIKEAYEQLYPHAEKEGSEDGEGPHSSHNEVTIEGSVFGVYERYDDGWGLGKRAEDGAWVLFRELETAPHVDAEEYEYVDEEGNTAEEAVGFEKKGRAEEAYNEYIGDYGRTRKKARGSGKKRSETEQKNRTRTDDETEGEIHEKEYLDALWSLCYRETSDGRVWTVTPGNGDGFLNPEGVYQRTEHRFETRDEAKEAYARYVEDTHREGDPNRSPFSEAGDEKREEEPTKNPNSSRSRKEKGRRRAHASSAVGSTTSSGTVDSFTDFVAYTVSDVVPSPSRVVDLPLRTVVYVVSLPVFVPIKTVSLVGPKRFVGALAVLAVGPFVLALMQSYGFVLNPRLRSMTLTEAFLEISLPSLFLAAGVQFIYETVTAKYKES
jgi:curved DNA-binding protein CbpA